MNAYMIGVEEPRFESELGDGIAEKHVEPDDTSFLHPGACDALVQLARKTTARVRRLLPFQLP